MKALMGGVETHYSGLGMSRAEVRRTCLDTDVTVASPWRGGAHGNTALTKVWFRACQIADGRVRLLGGV